MMSLNKILFSFFISIFFFTVYCQNEDEGASFNFDKKIRFDRKGQFYINPYYGFPHLEKLLMDYTIKNDSIIKQYNFYDIKTIGFGPLGIRAGYFINKFISLGIDFYYNQYYVEITDKYEVFDYNQQQNVTKFDIYRYTMQRYRFLFKSNFHFPTSSSKLDLHGGIGIGLNFRKFDFKENNVSVTDFQKDVEKETTVLPFSMRLNFGFRYYLTRNIGLNAELGLGGPLMSLGLMFRFNTK